MINRLWKIISDIAAMLYNSIQSTNANILRGILLPIMGIHNLEKILGKISENLDENKSSLNHKIDEARDALVQTSKIINELEVELNKNVENLEIAKDEYKKFSRLAKVERDSAASLLETVAETVDSGKKKERWFNFLISATTGIIIFIIGIWLGPFITNFFNINK